MRKRRLAIASMHLDKLAYDWFLWWNSKSQGLVRDWDTFKKKKNVSQDIDHIQNTTIQGDKGSQQQGYDDLEGEIRDLNKTLINKEEEIVHTRRELEKQDT
jgi:hypothetical protein